jgi:hypothetical protein
LILGKLRPPDGRTGSPVRECVYYPAARLRFDVKAKPRRNKPHEYEHALRMLAHKSIFCNTFFENAGFRLFSKLLARLYGPNSGSLTA